MRKYELMTIFPLDEDKYKKGSDAVRAVLSQFGAEIEKEEPFGDRDLTYVVKKQKRGRFVLFNIKVNPGKLVEIDTQFKLNPELIKYMFVQIEEK
ncbi:MAG: 30S ribosomal protein S6 [Spirochaetia bacterium]|nr:30S ribosomal protein S6 [Spirochaetia bacterium]MDD7699445.1 30S ribosomal protein S6 [Spirochaetia bacterium]MDY4210836.1 30S ribosomal protein S6 [Treponema sp.]